jgi:hypothetical protein
MISDWEQQENESARAYEAFCVYRNLGTARTLEKAWAIFAPDSEKNLPMNDTFKGYSSRYQWVKRVRAWDSHVLKLEDEALQAEAVKIKKTEKNNRLEMLKVLRAISAKAANAVIDDKGAIKMSEVKNVASIVALYMDQSRIEMGERLDMTQGKPAQVTINNNTSLELGDAVATAKERLQSLLTQKSSARTTGGDTEHIQ